jgi:hypothetical protein
MTIQWGACALHFGQLRLESHSHTICSIYCFSAANMATRTPFSVRFMHTLPVLLILVPKIFQRAVLFEGSQTILLVWAACRWRWLWTIDRMVDRLEAWSSSEQYTKPHREHVWCQLQTPIT